MKNVKINCKKRKIGNVTFGKNVEINCNTLILEDGVEIGDDCKFDVMENLTIRKNTIINKNLNLTCRKVELGKNGWIDRDVFVGGGGSKGVNAKLKIGDYFHIGMECVLNASYGIYIGDYGGISDRCVLVTHGAWLNILEGYPSKFGSINIGDNVWILYGAIIQPKINIGNNVCICAGSVVTKDVEDNSFVGGVPAKKIDYEHPKKISIDEKKQIIKHLIEKYCKDLKYKGFLVKSKKDVIELTHKQYKDKIKIDGLKISFLDSVVIFDLEKYKIIGETNELTEDFRDFLRRNGVRIDTDKKFRSLKYVK